MQFDSDVHVMQHALELARRGRGHVEPNPMVGAVVVTADRVWIADGVHQQFGGPHAEIHAITASGDRTRGADLFVTLEPCSHFGKTPPCADAVIRAGFRRVVIGCSDPAPHVDGKGIRRLRDAGIDVVVGVCEADSRLLIAPFERLMLHGRPWVLAKWAMTLDGRIASRTGHSKWISCDESRACVHQLRGCMDAIITGAGTVRADDPLLTARPAGPRRPLRVIIDSMGTSVTAATQLARSLSDGGIVVCVAANCRLSELERVASLGCTTLVTSTPDCVNLTDVLDELGRRKCTNVLLEAGPKLLGSFFDQQLADEVMVFVAPKIIGGGDAPGPIGGLGADKIPAFPNLTDCEWTRSGTDLRFRATICRTPHITPADRPTKILSKFS